MIRVAAVADLHTGPDTVGTLRPLLEGIRDRAAMLLLAGDLTNRGHPDEAEILAAELDGLGLPIVAVLGNHDYHVGREAEVSRILGRAGCLVLEGEATTLDVDGVRIGVAGVKGFGGGFAGACGSEFGEEEMKAFMRHTAETAERLRLALASLEADVRIALLHYAPIDGTLRGERAEIYPFLGSYLLGEAIDHAGADLALHGHAHRGTEKGLTAGGVFVRNVAQHVIGHAYRLYGFRAPGEMADEAPEGASSAASVA